MVAVRPEMRTLTSASRIAGRPSTGRISAPWPTIWTRQAVVGHRRAARLEGRPAARWSRCRAVRRCRPERALRPRRAPSARSMTGHSRFIAATDMRVPAIPSASRGSSPEKSRLPVSATPISALPNSPCSRSMRCLSGSIRSRSRTRLRTSGSGSTGAAEASTTVPPETCSPQTLLPSRGASNCANRVMRLPPDRSGTASPALGAWRPNRG